jgi:hypothetical protein
MISEIRTLVVLRVRSDPLQLLNSTPGAGGATAYFWEWVKPSFTISAELSGVEGFRTAPKGKKNL